MRRFDPGIEWFCEDYTEDYMQRALMEENAQDGEYVLWIDANAKINALQEAMENLVKANHRLEMDNMRLEDELDPASMEGWDE